MTNERSRILEVVRKQLSIDMNCSNAHFTQDGVFFCEARLLEGRRPFTRQTPFLEIATMGKGVVVSADAGVLQWVAPALENRTREDIFVAPFLYGHSIYYTPESIQPAATCSVDGFVFRDAEGPEIHGLYRYPGFENALGYDTNHPRPDVLATYAVYGNEIAAVAGASADCDILWQIGIDVLPAYRNKGLATILVRRLVSMIQSHGVVPYYGAASSNIASQAVAFRSGLIPTWMCSYHNTLDGTFPFQKA